MIRKESSAIKQGTNDSEEDEVSISRTFDDNWGCCLWKKLKNLESVNVKEQLE
jgi:hypothetical protein